jgi:hypothetical protein
MTRLLIAIALCGLASSGQAEQITLNDIKAQNGVQLSATELRQILPGATVSRTGAAGATIRWTNNPDGKFIASRDSGGGTVSAHGRQGHDRTAPGTWSIADNATYCVVIEWPVATTENWCNYIFKIGDKYYGIRGLTDGAARAMHEFEFSK